MALSLFVALVFVLGANTAAAEESLIWGSLPPGPHAVGFRAQEERDSARVERPGVTLEGAPQRVPITRQLNITMWYPAAPGATRAPMRFREYLGFLDELFDARSEDRRVIASAAERERSGLHALSTWGIFGGTPVSAWAPVLEARMRAIRDAPPASGRFPVVLAAPGGDGTAAYTADTCEYLASHGYVVLSAPSRGEDAAGDRLRSGAAYDAQVADLEHLIRFASRLSFADLDRIGLFGMSRGGAAAVLLAMKNPAIDAVVSWDSPMVEGARGVEGLRASASFDAGKLTAPILHVRAAGPGKPPALFEATRFAPRYLVSSGGRISHLDFSVIAMIHSALDLKHALIKSPPADTRAAHASLNVVTRQFLDAFVKGQGGFGPAQVAALAPAGAFTLESTPAAPAPPSPALLIERILTRGGIASARDHIARARGTDPEWRPFPESVLTGIAARMVELGRGDEAVQVAALNADLYPQSAPAWTALGETQEKGGLIAQARESYRRALEIDPANAGAAAAMKRIGGEGAP
jgi:dienelactone hydrolase